MAELYEYITAQGTIVADTADLQAQVEQEYRDAFGEDLIVTANTPQGVLIAAEVTARAAVLRNNAALANQINPDLAGGVFLDALWRLTGGQRRVATKSVLVNVALTGEPGTFIPEGSLAQTAAGDKYATTADVTLGVDGTAVARFEAEDFGPVPAPVGALSVIVSGVLGWETVTNPTAATLGRDRETDAAARRRRRNTLALQGVALSEAIASGLYDTEGVKSLTFRENPTNVNATISGILMVPHSMYVCVDGGTDNDVALALLAKRSAGCGWNGGTSVDVTDPTSGQTYAVRFDRPTLMPVLVRATVRNAGVVGSPVGIVQDAVMAYTRGELEDEGGFIVGGSVSPFELAGAVNRQAPRLYVQKMEVALASTGVYQTVELTLGIDKLATIDVSGITVIVL